MFFFYLFAAVYCDHVTFTDPYMEGKEITYDVYFGHDRVTWTNAFQRCDDQDKHLLVINSPYILEFIDTMLSDFG